MEKNPMWTDEKDQAESVKTRPFPKDVSELSGEFGVRVVTRRGVTYEGVSRFDRTTTPRGTVTVNGIVFARYAHEFYLLDPAAVVIRNPAPIELTDGEVRDLIADACGEFKAHIGRADSVSFANLVFAALGFDPTNGVPEREYGGRTKDAYINQFLRVSSLKRSLDRLAADGLIHKAVRRYDRSDDDSYVYVDGQVGYLTADAYDDAVSRVRAKRNASAISELRQEAVKIVAERHRDEIEAELDRLLEEKGLTR